jgi:hypothetical protein
MATTYRQRAEYRKEKKEHGQDFALKSIHQKIDASRSKELEGKKKEIAGKMKGKESLNIPRGEKDEGNKMEEGRNEHNRA